MRLTACRAAVVLGLVGRTGAVHAEPARPAALAWVRAAEAESCPPGQVIAAEVERLLASRPLVSMAQADIVIEGRVARTRGGTGADDSFETTLVLVDRAGVVLGTRKLTSTGPRCDALTGEVGLVIALMIDPEGALRAPAPTPITPVPEPAAPAPISPPVPPPVAFPHNPPAPPAAPPCSPAPPPAPWRTHLSLGPVVGLGLLPSPAVGLRLRGTVTPPGLFPFEVGGDMFAPSRAERDGIGLEMSLAQGRLRACPLTGMSAPWGLSACAGLDFGVLRTEAFGLPVNRSVELFVAAGVLGGRVELSLGRVVRLSLGAEVAIPAVRARVTYAAPDGTRLGLFTTSPLTGLADLGLGLEL